MRASGRRRRRHARQSLYFQNNGPLAQLAVGEMGFPVQWEIFRTIGVSEQSSVGTKARQQQSTPEENS
ncbi:hypothetical protein EYF80_058147 [Liparis tanakae]|uniref:Uncharacterized protein n=1 Tax=Liparis tanakae TaxID=230148 RepID=A0A4Z2ETI9_9TELE|nr:hypothetical protein EYF80_058147 [Liparis tanakae]